MVSSLLTSLTMRLTRSIGYACMAIHAGCFLPPSLESEVKADAAPNAIPVILDSTLPATGLITLQKQGQQPITLTVREPDAGDTVYVYFYVDYGLPDPTPSPNACQGAGPTLDRVLDCPLNSLCELLDSSPDEIHFLEAVTTDRARLNNGTPLFRAFPEGTGISYRSWLMTCVDSL